MATPDQLLLLEQQLGRTLGPEEMAQLDAELGGVPMSVPVPAAVQAPVVAPPQPVPVPVEEPAPAVAAPRRLAPSGVPAAHVTGDSLGSGFAFDARGQGTGHLPPSDGAATGMDAGYSGLVSDARGQGTGRMLPTEEPSNTPRALVTPEPTDEELMQILDDEPQGVDMRGVPMLDTRPVGDGGAGRWGQEAEAQRKAIEDARGRKVESMRNVQDLIDKTREGRRGNDIDREVAEQQLADQFKPRVDEAEQYVQSRIAAYESANRKAQDVQIKDRRTMGTKILGALAAGFGAVAQAKMALATGVNVGNPGAAAVERSIQNDLERQRMDLANARDTADATRSELGIAYEQLGDLREAEQVARTALREKYARAGEDLMGELQDAQQVAQIEGAVQDLYERNAAEREAGALRNQQLAQRRAAQMRAEQMARNQKELARAQAYQRSQHMAGGLRVADPTAFESYTGGDEKETAKVVQDTTQQIERSDGLFRMIDEIQNLRSRYASRLVGFQEAASQIESLQNQLVARYSKQEQLGALDNGTVELVGKIMGDSTSYGDLLTGSAGAKLDAYAGQLAKAQDTFLKSRGLAMRAGGPMGGTREKLLRSRVRPMTLDDAGGGGGQAR